MKNVRLPKVIKNAKTLETYLKRLARGTILKHLSYAKRSLRKWEILIAYAKEFNRVPSFKGKCALCFKYNGAFFCIESNCVLLNMRGKCFHIPIWENMLLFIKDPTQWIVHATRFYEWMVERIEKKKVNK